MTAPEKTPLNVAFAMNMADGKLTLTLQTADLDVAIMASEAYVQRFGSTWQNALPLILPLIAKAAETGFHSGFAAGANEPSSPSTSLLEIAAIQVAVTAKLEPAEVALVLSQTLTRLGVMKVHYPDGRVRLVGLGDDFDSTLENVLTPHFEAEVDVELLTQEDLDVMNYHGEFCFYVDQLVDDRPDVPHGDSDAS